MALILALSSQVAHGCVGLSAAAPVWHRLGHDVIALPTILLSNHPAHPQSAGLRVDPDVLRRMFDTLAAAGHLNKVDAIVTGYLPSAAHVELASDIVDRVRLLSPGCTYLCDPIFGDKPDGMYLDPVAAVAIRDRLVLRAGILTPNAFELGWLTSRKVASLPEAIAASCSLAGSSRLVVTTSVASGRDELATIAVSAGHAASVSVAKKSSVPNGTGDLFAALFLGHLLAGLGVDDSLSRAAAGTEIAISASLGRLDLQVVANMDRIVSARTNVSRIGPEAGHEE